MREDGAESLPPTKIQVVAAVRAVNTQRQARGLAPVEVTAAPPLNCIAAEKASRS